MRFVLLSSALAIGLVWAGPACSTSASTAPGAEAGPGEVDGGATGDGAVAEGGVPSLQITVHAVVDLPRSAATQALSATAFDEGSRTLFALQDTGPRIVPLVGNSDFTTFTVGTPLELTGRFSTP